MALALSGVLAAVILTAAAAGWSYITRLSKIDPLPSRWPPTPKKQGLFATNSVLQGIEKLGVGQLPGPEDIAVDEQGRLYTGCADGWINRISPAGEIQKWAHVGGHPLGLVWGRDGNLLVCEPTKGLLNVTEGKIEVLSSEADGVEYKLADGVDVAKDGSIYFTDASHTFGMKTSALDILQGRPNGRLLKYDPATRTTTVLRRELFFANGVALSEKEDFLVVCETSMMRCLKYWLQGEREGTMEVFIENLPGYPDNIRHNGRDRFWIGLVAGRAWLTDALLKISPVKHILALPGVLEKVSLSSKMAKVLAVSETGQPLAFLEDPTGASIAFVTTALEVGDYLYLGNLATNYIGKLKVHGLAT